jgi:hypothetical protein
MPSNFHETPSMKNPWSQNDLDRLIWKTLDLIVDAATSLQIVKDVLAIDLSEEKPTPRIPRRKSLAKRR